MNSDDQNLYRHAAAVVVTTQFGSASMVAQRLGVSAARAAEAMAELEAQGVVGPVQPGRSRDVLIRADQLPELLDTTWLDADLDDEDPESSEDGAV